MLKAAAATFEIKPALNSEGRTKDIPPRSMVIGVPGKISPLPQDLDRDNNPALTIQPVDLWHPAMPDLAAVDWPKDWPQDDVSPAWQL